jgi:hypothetical protein
MKIKLKIMVLLCVILFSGCTKQEVSKTPAGTAAAKDTGSVAVLSDVAGMVLIDGEETGTQVKSNGTVTINGILNGDTEVAVKLDDGTIVRAADMVPVRSGETVTVQIKASAEQPKIVEAPVIPETPSVTKPAGQTRAADKPARPATIPAQQKQPADKPAQPAPATQSAPQNQADGQTGSRNQRSGTDNGTNNAQRTEPPPAANAPAGRTITSEPLKIPEPTIQTVDPSFIEAARQAQQQSAAKVYKIGDAGPAGGIVFYDKGSYSDGWRYLEAAPPETEFAAEWGADEKDVPGTTQEVGSGKRNTQIIVKNLQQSGESGRAAQLCEGLNFNGFTDWFLPSRDELFLMYKNLEMKGLGDFVNSWYWSSSQSVNIYAWVQNFDTGRQDRHLKSIAYWVLAVRAY